jgi:hypothetical protein
MAKRTTTADDAAPQTIDAIAEAAQAEESVMSETYTYADGSSVVGRPPWPEKSPLERARDAAEGKAEA